jgi:hypothetical protein
MGDDPKKPFVLPGEIISQAQREKLGLNRLRRWFENGTLEQADFKPVEAQRRLALQTRSEAPVAVLEQEEAGLDTVEKLIDEVIEPNVPAEKAWDQVEKDQAREDRNRKAREKRAADKKAEAKRVERNRKAREKRVAAKAAELE